MADPVLDPITRSVLAGALAGVAEEMGATMVRGAYSANIKERRDSSAALFDAEGRMVAQAAHIPVHLGAMPEAVQAVLARHPVPGDVWLLNDPYRGGTHLPDITTVAPVTLDGEVVAYAVTRAHHNDVGGMAPGSMPARSRELYQEGLIIPPVRLVAGGTLQDDVFDLILANVRVPDLRRGDLRAQLAGSEVAGARLVALAERHGRDTVLAAFTDVLDYADRRTRDRLADLPDGTWRAEGQIEGDGVTEDDLPLRVAVTVAGDAMTIDFAGSADQAPGNVNCPLAVTRSACFFALRLLLPDDVPANAGTYRALDIRAPEGSLLHARSPAAVVAGNVETSQRAADVVVAALAQVPGLEDLPADGMGTMNNLIIGGQGWSSYETIGGGQGASRAGPGPSGVHVGMSNTRNTPVEALELEHPMRVERYELRDGSGGEGVHRGGDGIVRAIRVLEEAEVSVLTERRRHHPAGREGGGDGALGINRVDGQDLGSKDGRRLDPGSVVEVHTPGGGGWGSVSPA